MTQLLEVDIVKGECVVAQVGEDMSEQVRVPVEQQNGLMTSQLTTNVRYNVLQVQVTK